MHATSIATLSPAAERIVDAAEAYIQEVGFNGFSFEEAVHQSGANREASHELFASKVELVLVMTRRFILRFQERLRQIDESYPSPTDRLETYAGLFSSAFGKERRLCICGMLSAEINTLPPEIQHEVRRFLQINMEWLVSAVEQGQAADEISKSQPADALARLLLSALEGAMLVGRGWREGDWPSNVAKALLRGWRP